MIKKVIFSDYEKVFSAISEILKTSGVKEPPIEDETARGDSLTSVLTKATRDLAAKKITESDLSPSLIKDFGVSKQVANGIIKNIKEKLIPLTETIEIDENYIPPTEDFVTKAIKEVEVEELKTEDKILKEVEPTENIKKPTPTINDKKISGPSPLNKNLDTDKKIAQEPDQYREPI